MKEMDSIPTGKSGYGKPEERSEDQKLTNLYRIILDNVSSGVALIDSTGRFLLYNSEFLRLFGLSADSTIINVNDQKWSDWQVFTENLDLLHVDEHPVRKVFLSGNPVKNMLVAVRLPSGGDLIWMLVSAEPVFEKGTIQEVICTYQNVTEQTLIDTKLRKNEDRLRLALDAADAGTWELDLITGNAIRSLRHDQIFGYNEIQKEWTLEIALKHIHPDDRKMVKEVHENAAFTGNMSVEARVLGNDGSIRWINLMGRTQYDNKGRPVRIIGMVLDITARKQTELRLRELVETKNKFFNIIAHDLRNPFTSLIGSSELLMKSIEQLGMERAKLLASVINDASKHGFGILQNLLDWTRSQTGMLKLEPERINLKKLVDEQVEGLRQFSFNKEIVISSMIRSNLYVVSDRNVLNTIIRNLVDNAVKFTHRNGKIEISSEQKNGTHVISVKDNGIGIPLKDLKAVFSEEIHQSALGTEMERGTGIGLKLCKEFVQKLNGEIWVESIEGEGSTFSFSIPNDSRGD